VMTRRGVVRNNDAALSNGWMDDETADAIFIRFHFLTRRSGECVSNHQHVFMRNVPRARGHRERPRRDETMRSLGR
jgi:hypothetical protein